MENQEELSKLYFELASDSRLQILSELSTESLKMQEVARRLDVTATEAFRQLERLGGASLVARQPEGAYSLTAYGRLVLQSSTPLAFLLKHKTYFLTHDAAVLPYQFLNRIGELSKATLISDTMESLNRGQRVFIEMNHYGWGMAEGVVPELMVPVMERQQQKGIKMRFIVPDGKLPPNPLAVSNIETRTLDEVPVVIAFSEKAALFCMRSIEGKMDYSAFYGSDPVFLGWIRELFLYYWEKAKRP